MSPPRSNRVDASVFSPSRLLVLRTELGSKYALSSAIVLVAGEISESDPPMTPPIATARSPSAMTSVSASNVRSIPSSVRIGSLATARRTTIRRFASRSRSKACIGWPISSIT